MAFFRRDTKAGKRSFLARLSSDTAGNVFAMTAAAVVPMIGVVGGAVDASRLYLTRTRLQAACDAGVLAIRKAMPTAAYTTDAENRGVAMFNFNFQDRDFGTTGTDFDPSGDATGKVSATALTTVPMTLMQVFGMASKSLSVTCSADIQIPNIDVVFVLDVTGSMANELGDTGQTRIVALRAAAKTFYQTLAAQMATSGANAGQVRYGFVPYDQTVRVTDLFKASPNTALGEASLSNLADTMTVQSRVANMTTGSSSGSGQWVVDTSQSATTYTQQYRGDQAKATQPYENVNGGNYKISNNDCGMYGMNQSFNINGNNGGTNVTMFPRTSFPGQGVGDSVLFIPQGSSVAQVAQPTTGTSMTRITFARKSGSWEDDDGAKINQFQKCERTVTHTKYKRSSSGFRFTNWTYKPITFDVSAYKTGTAIQYINAIDNNYDVDVSGSYDPVQLRALTDQSGLTSTSTTWNGCIEERDTVAVNSFNPIPGGAFDLNWLLAGTTDATKWRPVMRDLTYDRNQRAELTTTGAKSRPATSCPAASVRNLNAMTQTAFDNYIDTLEPGGLTYLDVGMIWGLRLIAPQGMFGYRNLTGPNGGQISRHIIFLTDGDPVSSGDTYSAYGVEDMAKRITLGLTDSAATLHARRFKALCDGMRGTVSIWAIALDTSVASNLSACADTGRAFEADDADDLNDAFRNIANQIADLRLVQ